MTAAAEPRTPASHGWRRARRIVLGLLIAAPASALVLFVLVHRVPWLGPALADGLRGVIGAQAVTRLEEWVYGVEDRIHRWRRAGEAPRAYWEVPPPAEPVDGARRDAGASADAATRPSFRPRDVGPFDATHAAPGDGVWVRVVDPARPSADPLLYKTAIHPDRKRPWAVVFVVAIDRARSDLRLVAGSVDPEATLPGARSAPRPARIPEPDQERLIAAFNGGFKTEHGRYGMHVNGVTLIAPRPDACTVVRFHDGSLRIATWSKLADRAANMTWWRQTPPCMVEDAELHPALRGEGTTGWGAALGGETTIRRSAIGLDASGTSLLVALSEYTTAGAMAQAMLHAGAVDAAQLDVNWSFPRFVLYRRDVRDGLVAEGLFPGFVFESDEYIGRRSPRDFFYVLAR